MTTATTVVLEGPFFTHDPQKTILQNLHQAMEGYASEGEKVVRQLLLAGSAQRDTISQIPSSRVAEYAIGRVRSLTGRAWVAAAVVSVNNSGLSPNAGISLMAAASFLEQRTHAFAKTARAFRVMAKILRANLTKGIE